MENIELFERSGFKVTGKKILKNEKGKLGYIGLKICHRCGGAGGSDRWIYTGWTCYECGGAGNTGTKFIRLYTSEELKKLDERAEKAKEKELLKKNMEIESRRENFLLKYSSLLNKAEPYVEHDNFIKSVVWQMKNLFKITDKQIEYLEKAIEKVIEKIKLEAKKAEKGNAPKGRVLVSGLVVYTKYQPSMYGEQLKMLVELENGATVWGAAPKKLLRLSHEKGSTLQGNRIKFEADFTPSNDNTHAFFKSPSKVELL
jgi:hypothetical protein